MRKKIRSIHIILFVMLFLVGSFIDISTIHAEAGSRTGSIQIIYKGRNSSDKEVTLSGAKFSIFPIQYMKMMSWSGKIVLKIQVYHYKIPVQKQEKNRQNNCLHLRRKMIFPA